RQRHRRGHAPNRDWARAGPDGPCSELRPRDRARPAGDGRLVPLHRRPVNGLPILSIVTFVPLVGAIVVALLPARLARPAALTTSLIAWLVSLGIAASFAAGGSGFQFVEQASWIPLFGIEYKLGVDGLSLAMVVLT